MPTNPPVEPFYVTMLSGPIVIGVVGWLSLLIAIPSLYIALSQIRKVKTATEAAAEGIRSFKTLVVEHDITSKLAEVMKRFHGAIGAIERKNYEAAVLHLDAACDILVDIKEIGDSGDRESAQKLLVNVRADSESLILSTVGGELSAKGLAVPKRLRVAYSLISERHAKSRYKFMDKRDD